MAKFYQNEINTINGVIANSQAGADQAFMGADELIRGVEPYRDAAGHTHELSNQYGNAWMNGSNEYVLSDDPNFNPQSVLNGSWTQLEHVQRQP
jgi:hypothetical protein